MAFTDARIAVNVAYDTHDIDGVYGVQHLGTGYNSTSSADQLCCWKSNGRDGARILMRHCCRSEEGVQGLRRYLYN